MTSFEWDLILVVGGVILSVGPGIVWARIAGRAGR